MMVGIPDIAAHHLQVVPALDDLQPPPVVKGVVQAQGPDTAAHVQQGFGEMGADEAVGAGNQYSFVSEFHFGVRLCLLSLFGALGIRF
jgi:hypothetical protein